MPDVEISIHALREEGDSPRSPSNSAASYFYPRPPRGGRHRGCGISAASGSISIHALREEGDMVKKLHSPALSVFLSTPSARRATRCAAPAPRSSWNFYPRPPRGGRPDQLCQSRVAFDFYPRPPRGGRPRSWWPGTRTWRFLSTPSARRATSIRTAGAMCSINFYPRPPRGGRPQERARFAEAKLFLSTPSARRATAIPPSPTWAWTNFYPRPPRGGRRPCPWAAPILWSISIHALREEGDRPAHVIRRSD